jgi:hypothetical protein
LTRVWPTRAWVRVRVTWSRAYLGDYQPDLGESLLDLLAGREWIFKIDRVLKPDALATPIT